MKTFNFYDDTTGVIHGQQYTGPYVGLHTPEGHTPIPAELIADALSQRVDIAAMQAARDAAPWLPEPQNLPPGFEHKPARAAVEPILIDYMPPAPDSTDLVTWERDEEAKRWRAVDTEAAVAARVRAERDSRLAACDWMVTKAAEQGKPIPEPWRAYRQALRDVPAQPGYPRDVQWPAT